MKLSTTLLIATISALFFFLICLEFAWVDTMKYSLVCPKNINPYDVLEKYNYTYEIKVIDKDTKQIKKTYKNCEFCTLNENSFVISYLDEKIKITGMMQLEPNESIRIQRHVNNFNPKEWGLNSLKK